MESSIINEGAFEQIHNLDKELSQRFISLDPNGYFLIKLNVPSNEIIVEHYSNNIDNLGRAIDPETGDPIGCRESKKRMPIKIYKGRSAKEIGIKLTEEASPSPISRLDHALYLGRELQKAEFCLIQSTTYIQD